MENELVKLNSYDETYIGYIISENENNVILKTYDEFGVYKGYLLLKKDNIVTKEENTSYLRIIQYLIYNKPECLNKDRDLIMASEKNIEEILKTLKDKKVVCKIVLNNFESIYGVIYKIDKDYLYVEDKGQYCAKISEIRNIYCDSKESRKEMYCNEVNG